jgi:murein DD-endopeptidase MepM/ murein hydrolase activator NlpD
MFAVLRRPALTRAMVTGLIAISASAVPDGATAAAVEPPPAYLVLPVREYRLTGRFGDRSSLWSTVHTGLDFAAPSGTPIRSIGPGRVLSTGYDGSFGNKTVVRLADGTELWFCHQSVVSVQPGERVHAGQVIGAIGSTGNVTGPHLHLEVHPHGGEPVDPLTWLRRLGLRP